MRVLGIDPGLATIGVGVVDCTSPYDAAAVDWFVITTPAGLPMADRLHEIEQDLRGFIAEAKPDLAVVERVFFAVNEQSAIEVAHARGVILAVVAGAGLRVIEPTPLQLKSAIAGDGSADKRQMQDSIARLLKLPKPPTPADAADALALALYGGITDGAPGLR